ncbi:MAG: arabinose isomerase [Eubacterium sp.]|nr:arabinose isomerase [Eubacterium sp.]
MLVETKAKVGVFSIALQAYLPQFPELVPEFQGQYEAFKKTIPDTVEIIDGGMVTTKEESQAAGDKFRAADVDVVFLQLLTYCTSYNMLPAVRDLDVPVVLFNLQKVKCLDFKTAGTADWLGIGYAGGAVGEMVADLERAGKRHAVVTGVVEGGDPGVQKEMEEWCKAAQVRRRFRDTNLAQIGRPYPGMMDLYIDETNLYHRMYVYTKQFDWEKMWAIADNITDEKVIADKVADIHDTFDVIGDYNEEDVHEMARYVVAFEQWVKDEKLGFIASHYDGFAQGKAGKLDSMLIPAFSMLIKQGVACAVEGDIKVAMGMAIMKVLTGATQLSEFYTFDFNDDVVLIGHSGSGDACFSDARKASMEIVPVFHGKAGGGFLTRFYPSAGPITFLGITQDRDGHFKFVVSEGEIEDGPTLGNGDTTFRTRFSIGAREWNNRWCECGPTHHFAAGRGHLTSEILKVAEILNVPVTVVC